jgi:threonine dehydrogenase-like Zn-dependent dehydrogenase
MNTIKALQFVEPQKVRMIEIEKTEPQKNQVAIKLLATSLCNHSELRSYYGGSVSGYGSNYPMLIGEPGHEGVGIIVKKGENVNEFEEGDIVVMTGHGGEPTHRSYLIREAKDVALVTPQGREPKNASILEMYGCAYHCIRKGWSEISGYDDKSVAVIGSGAIGLCAIQILKCWPIKKLFAFDIQEDKLDLAKKSGADVTIKLPKDDGFEKNMIDLPKFDIVVECSGSRNGQLFAYSLRPMAIINVSYYPKPIMINQADWFNSNTTIYNPGFLSSIELRAMAALYNRRLIDPEILISKMIKPDPEEYLNTIKEIEDGKIVKALIDWEKV